MTDIDRDMIERYIYDVVRRLPAKSRDEIGLELKGLINDMMEEGGDDGVEQVLLKLGDPAQFARKYRDENGYLIGPEYYDDYIWLLKIILLCVGGSALLSLGVNLVMAGAKVPMSVNDIVRMVVEMILDGCIALITAFGFVTAMVAVLERKHILLVMYLKNRGKWTAKELKGRRRWTKADQETEEDQEKGADWMPQSLPNVPEKKSRISRGECVAGIVFIVIFSGLLIFTPGLFGGRGVADGVPWSVPLFNLEHWNIILPVFLLILGVDMVREVVKLMMGRYCATVAVGSVACGILEIILSVVLIKGLPLWNPDFMVQIEKFLDIRFTSSFDLLHYWNTDFFGNVLLAFILFANLLDIATVLYRTIRYGDKGVTA